MKHKVAILILASSITTTLLFVKNPSIYWPVLIAITLLFITFLIIGTTTIKWNYFLPSINRVKPNQICFTFDDGPCENSLKILGILEKHNVKATFFLIGKNCETAKRVQSRSKVRPHPSLRPFRLRVDCPLRLLHQE